MSKLSAMVSLAASLLSGSAVARPAKPTRPAIVLVDGAFADPSRWRGVGTTLQKYR